MTRKKINNIKIAVTPDSFHNILKKSPRSTLSEGLERSRGQEIDHDFTGLDNPVEETTIRVNQPIPISPNTAPEEKTGPYSDKGFAKDINNSDEPNLEGRKKYKHKKNVKTSQKLSDYIKQIEHSAVVINVIDEKERYVGSGFFINKNNILTCAHVLGLTNNPNENNTILSREKIYIEFNNRNYQVTTVLYDVTIDFAVLSINSEYYGIKDSIYPINLGNSGNISKGDYVIVIGNPLDMYNATKGGMISYIAGQRANDENKYCFYFDATVMPGDSGGMIYNIEKQAVIGITNAFAYVPEDEFANALGVGVKIDIVKNYLKMNNIPFTYNENNNDNPTQAQLSPILFKKQSKTIYRNGYEIEKTNPNDESVGPSGGGNVGSWGKKRNRCQRHDFPPSEMNPTCFYPHMTTGVDSSFSGSVNSTPFDNMDDDLKKDLSIKNRLDMFDKNKGFWLFNIPLSIGTKGKEKLQVYKKNGNDFYVYLNNKVIMSVKNKDQIKKPLLYIMQQLSKKFQFDTSYSDYMKDYGLHYTS